MDLRFTALVRNSPFTLYDRKDDVFQGWGDPVRARHGLY